MLIYQLYQDILHLFFPDVFESVVSADHKQRIVKAFREYVDSDEGNLDEKLSIT